MVRHCARILVCAGFIATTIDVRAAIDIANGVGTSEWPAVGTLLKHEGNSIFSCTATLISPTWVLTAAHCVVDSPVPPNPADFSFVMQTDYACCFVSGGLSVVAAVSNPGFMPLDPNPAHDQGLVQLATPVTDVVPFTVNADLMPPGSGSFLEVLGYGLLENDSNTLKRRGLLQVTSSDDVHIFFGSSQPYMQLCAGDSGSPAYAFAANGFPVIYGTGSFLQADSDPCSMTNGAVDSRTDSDIAWILSHATDACTTSTPANCDGIFRNGMQSLAITPAAPLVTAHPAGAQLPAEWIATFRASAVGDPLPTIQWQTSADGGAFTDILGATAASLDVQADPSIDGSHYRAVFTNALDTAQTSDAVLIVLPRIDYVPWHCTDVAGTLDIYWEEVDGALPACIGIEHTDGSLADADDGTFSMNGTSVSAACLAPAKYSFTLSGDHKTLGGNDTLDNVPMTLTLSDDGACFVGRWTSGPDEFVATIWNFVNQ